MKKQLLKRLLAFIVMMFSISFLHAQCAGNKVRLCKPTRSGCAYKCVPQGQVQKYISQGWGYFCDCNYPFGNNSKSQKTKSSVTAIDKMEFSKKRKVMDSKK